MAAWSDTTKHLPSSINSGNQYTVNDQVAVEALNNTVENAFYAVRVADNAQAATNNGVSYDAQTPTSTEKTQARTNIEAASASDLSTAQSNITALQGDRAKVDASNLSSSNVDSWQNALVTPYSRHLNTNLEFTDISDCSTLQEIVDLAKANKGQLLGSVGNISSENTPLRALLGNPSGFGNYTRVSSSACYRLGDTYSPNAYVVELVAVGLYIGKLAKGYVFHDQTTANWSGWTILK